MKKYQKIYLDAFGYDETDFIPSEYSGEKANDIHHIFCKGMGGDPQNKKERIENLIALTRGEHERFGDNKLYMKMLLTLHYSFLMSRKVEFDEQYLRDLINDYS